jgi:hypothetical protein
MRLDQHRERADRHKPEARGARARGLVVSEQRCADLASAADRGSLARTKASGFNGCAFAGEQPAINYLRFYSKGIGEIAANEPLVQHGVWYLNLSKHRRQQDQEVESTEGDQRPCVSDDNAHR